MMTAYDRWLTSGDRHTEEREVCCPECRNCWDILVTVEYGMVADWPEDGVECPKCGHEWGGDND